MISGNGGNGLRITNSNDTTVQANFLGVGREQRHGRGQRRRRPAGLGDVGEHAGRRRDPAGQRDLRQRPQRHRGPRHRPAASPRSTPSPASSPSAAAAPNRRDGILITSTGGNNLIRTCIVSGNLGNGIEIGGNATGVQVTETAVGTNTQHPRRPCPNGGRRHPDRRPRPRQRHRRLPALDRAAGDGLVEWRVRDRRRRLGPRQPGVPYLHRHRTTTAPAPWATTSAGSSSAPARRPPRSAATSAALADQDPRQRRQRRDDHGRRAATRCWANQIQGNAGTGGLRRDRRPEQPDRLGGRRQHDHRQRRGWPLRHVRRRRARPSRATRSPATRATA